MPQARAMGRARRAARAAPSAPSSPAALARVRCAVTTLSEVFAGWRGSARGWGVGTLSHDLLWAKLNPLCGNDCLFHFLVRLTGPYVRYL